MLKGFEVASVSVVAHAPTPALETLVAAIIHGVREVPDVDLWVAEALTATTEDLSGADLTILVTPANFGYISGALKHAFDINFRAMEGRTAGQPHVVIIRGTTDTTGAVKAIEGIVRGLGWRAVRPPWTIEGEVTEDHLAELRELGEALATAAQMGAL